MKFCVRCGAQLDDNAKFCMTCGAQQPAAPQAQQPYAPQAQQPYAPQAQQPYTPAQGGSPFAPGGQPGAGAPVPPPQKKKGGKVRGCLIKTVSAVVSIIVFAIGYVCIDALIDSHAEKVEQKHEEETVAYVQELVQNNLDLLCYGTYDEDFLETVNMSVEDAEALYLSNLGPEVDGYIEVFQIDYPTEDVRAELTDLVKDVFSHIKYEINSVTYGETSCTAKVTVYPMDILPRMSEDLNSGGMDWIWEKYDYMDLEDMDDETYQAFDRDWAEGMMNLLRDALADVGYAEPETVNIRVSLTSMDSEKRWLIEDESFKDFGACILEPIPDATADDGAAA